MILVFTHCSRINQCDKKEKFTLTRQDYTGTQLKTNGYYYSDKSLPKIFYRNGVMLYTAYINTSINMESIESRMISGEYYTEVKDKINNWNLFIINNNEIKYEYFLRKGELNCWYPVIASGIILNDTTIQFTNLLNSDGTEPKTINDIWHFKAFSPKPDSTNSFTP